jgi:osmotically-inducible protein OsmY
MKKFKLSLKAICLSLTLCSLSACVTSIVTTGAQACYEHHNIQNTLYDQMLYVKVDRAVHWYNKQYGDSHVDVSVFDHVVILTGEVPSEALRSQLVTTVKQVKGVTEVENLTTLNEPISSLTSISDSWITTKIRTRLIADNDIDPDRIKVITENGTVYLIGLVFIDEAETATQIARQTSGVQKVVRVFSYLHINKCSTLNSPAKSTTA